MPVRRATRRDPPGKIFKRFVRDMLNKSWTLCPVKIVGLYADEMRADIVIKFKAKNIEPMVVRKVPIVVPRGGNAALIMPFKVNDICLAGFSKYALHHLLDNREVTDRTFTKYSKLFNVSEAMILGGFVLNSEVGEAIDLASGPNWSIPTDGPVLASDENFLLHSRKFIKLGGDSLYKWSVVQPGSIIVPGQTIEPLDGSRGVGVPMGASDECSFSWLVPDDWDRSVTSPPSVFIDCLVGASASGTLGFDGLFYCSKEDQQHDSNPGVMDWNPQILLSMPQPYTHRVEHDYCEDWPPPDKWYGVDFHFTRTGTYANDIWIRRIIFQYKRDQLGYALNYETIV